MHLLDRVEKYDIDEAGINLKHSKYFNEPDFINTIEQYNNGIVILSLNTQSLNAKYDELSIFITNITRSTNITALCLQETWLSDESTTSIYNIPGYSMFSKGKTCTNHGGLITYVNYLFTVNIIENNCNMTNWECLSVEIFNNDTPDDIIIQIIHNVYNKPYDTVVNF